MSNSVFIEKVCHPAMQFHSSKGASCIGWAVLMILYELPYLCFVKLSKIGAQYLANRYFHKRYDYKGNLDDFLFRLTLMGSSNSYNELIKKSRRIWSSAYDEMSSFVKESSAQARFTGLLSFVQEVEEWKTIDTISKNSSILKLEVPSGESFKSFKDAYFENRDVYFEGWNNSCPIPSAMIAIEKEGDAYSVLCAPRDPLLNDLKLFFPDTFVFADIIKKYGRSFGEKIAQMPLVLSDNSFNRCFYQFGLDSDRHFVC